MSVVHHVLVTRPKDQSEVLCHQIEALGHRAYSIPMLKITPITPAVHDISDHVIFLSANAARYFPQLALPPSTKVFAIGPSTRDVLLERGIQVTAIPSQFNSEGLLALPQLQQLGSDSRVTIVSGRRSLGLLSDQLQARGVHCQQWEVYERHLADVQQALDSLLAQVAISHVMLSSGESLQHYIDLMQSRPQQLQAQTLVVISQRVADLAQAMGVEAKVLIARETSDAGFCDALLKGE